MNAATLNELKVRESTIHVFFAGREFRVETGELGPDHLRDDRHLRRTLARYLGVDLNRLRDHVVFRHSDGDISLRPRSVFDR